MNKLLLLLLLFSSINFSLYSQSNKQDSLLTEFEKIESLEEKLSFCLTSGKLYISDDWDNFEFWLNKGVEIAKENKHPKIIEIYSELSEEAISLGKIEQAAEYIHQGKTYITDDTPVKSRYFILRQEADYYLRVDQFDMSKKKGYELIALAETNNDTLELTAALHNLGINYYKEGDYSTADSLISIAYERNKAVKYEPFIINNLSMLANIAGRLGNQNQALKYNLIVKEKFDTDKNLSGMSMIRVNISGNYFDLGQKKIAYKTLEEGIKLAKKHNFKRWEWIGYSTLSGFHNVDKNYKAALDNYVLYNQLKTSVVNENSATKLNSLTEQLNLKQLEILENKEALQEEKLNVQAEKIKFQDAESKEKKIINYTLIIGLLAACLFGLFVYNRLKLTNRQNVIIQDQKVKVDLAYEELGVKSKEITDSIIYAKRIQSAILPPNKIIKNHLPNSFILYKPKDIVAGDFYWFQQIDNVKLIAACDCTGHGVPGALVSVICNNSLNRTVKEFGLLTTGEILSKTRELVIQEFSKSEEEVKDGMDIALCKLDGNTLTFSGANNPLWIIRNNEIKIIKGDKQPIGQFHNPVAFTTHSIDLIEGDSFYIFSDGYADQFGGEKGKKYKSKIFKELLLSIQSKSMEEQKVIINNSFESWRGDLEQIDDVCVIGVKM